MPHSHLGHSQCRAPLVFQNIQADGSLAVNIGVVHLGLEGNLRGLERVVGREVDGHKKHAARVGAVGWALCEEREECSQIIDMLS